MSGFPKGGGGGGGGGSGTVTSVAAADTSVVIGGTPTIAPTVRTNTLDVIATDHPPAADWSNNSKKITNLANGTNPTDAANVSQIVGGSFPDYTGSGSPEGVQTAIVGKSYTDTTNGALYWKLVGTGNTGWALGGNSPDDESGNGLIGVGLATDGRLYAYCAATKAVFLGDLGGFVGSGDCLKWDASGGDGLQVLDLILGSAGQYQWYFNPDGSTVVPGVIHGPVLELSANSATPAIDTDNYDIVHITAQTAAITSFSSGLTGTPQDGDTLRISITGTTAIALTWGASFEASTVALPTTTISTDRLDVGFLWNTETSKWRCVAVA